jgi:hypothetical protein
VNGFTAHLSTSSIAGLWLLVSRIGLILSSNVSSKTPCLASQKKASLTRVRLAIHSSTKPGGWVEFLDLDMSLYSSDGSLSDDDPLLKWNLEILNAARMIGREPNPGPLLAGLLRDAGFVQVKEEVYPLPIGTWPKDKDLVSALLTLTGGRANIRLNL